MSKQEGMEFLGKMGFSSAENGIPLFRRITRTEKKLKKQHGKNKFEPLDDIQISLPPELLGEEKPDDTTKLE